jgi:glycerol-3-phosphate acyltransferase PlsX
VIARLGAGSELRVVPAEDIVGMGEGALAGFRRPRSSIAVACQLVRRGQATAVVSAGSTGAIVASARQRLLEVPGVPRPGLAVVLPTHPNHTVLIDAGATADPKPEMLVQFGQLGVAYAQIALGIAAPKVGLLTIGAEPGKGNILTRRAHELLAAEPQGGALPLNFAGNVEGGDLMAGAVDVIVTDGFTGNVALKTLEGSMKFVAAELRSALTGTRPGGSARCCSAAGCASSASASTPTHTAARPCSGSAAASSSRTGRRPHARSAPPARSPRT